MMMKWRFKLNRWHILHGNVDRLSLLLHCRVCLSISNIVEVESLDLSVLNTFYKAHDDYQNSD